MSELKTVDSASFQEEVLNSDVPVLVDFSAVWCGPCKRQTPILEDLAKEHIGAVKFVKLDIDECPEISSKYNIRSVPSLILFKNGEKAFVKVGLTKLSDLNDLIENAQFELTKFEY